MLDAVARRYGTDPATVLEWGPHRLRLAVECTTDADADTCRRLASIASSEGLVLPVVVIGQA